LREELLLANTQAKISIFGLVKNNRIKIMAKKEIKEKSIEVALWESANKLRGSVESAEYKHVVLGLIFLKFASDKFEEHRNKLIADGKEKYIEMPDFYNMSNVFFLEEISRWRGYDVPIASVTPEVKPDVTPEVEKLLELMIKHTELSRSEVQRLLELKDEKNIRIRYISPALKNGWLELTIPDKPNSRLQKYRITEKGRSIVL